MDLQLPGLLNAAIKDCPVFGGKVKSFDAAAVMSRPGVKKVVHMSSSAIYGAPKDNPVKVSNLHASFCQALGIDPDKKVMTPLQRPFKLVEDGTPIKELFA